MTEIVDPPVCAHCRKRIVETNWYNGPGWNHAIGGPTCGSLRATPLLVADPDDGCTGEGRGRGHTYTEAEVKVLTETASKVAYALGRKDAGEEIAAAIMAHRDADDSTREFRLGLSLGAKFARDIASQPSQASSDATSGVPGVTRALSEAVRSPQEPPKLVCRRCNGYGLLGVAAGVNPVPCPDCAIRNTP